MSAKIAVERDDIAWKICWKKEEGNFERKVNEDIIGNKKLFSMEVGKSTVENVKNCSRIKYKTGDRQWERMMCTRLGGSMLRICIMWIQKAKLLQYALF